MKKLIYLSICALILMLANACTDLDVPVVSELNPSNYPTTEEQYLTACGAAYTQFANGYTDNYWLISELSGDAVVLTANGSNWLDGGQYMQLHYHTWNNNHPGIKDLWGWLYKTINTTNKITSLLKDAPESDAKATSIGELRALRAYCYFLLMDNFGGAPLMTEFGQPLKAKNSRKEIYDFVESELKEVTHSLRDVNNLSTWGRPTQLTAYAILAKMYLNAEVYTGVPKYNEAVDACDKVIAFETSGQTKLTTKDNYLKMFAADNGPSFNEILFAIPYDENYLQAFRAARYTWGPYQTTNWGYKFSTSSCMRMLPDYYDLYADDSNDCRLKQYFTGMQYIPEGTTSSPMMINATKYQLDNRYTGTDKDTKVDYQLRYTKEIEFRNLDNFDTGDDVTGRYQGYRSNKYPPSKTQTGRFQSNDFPVLRYADVLLMKAEAMLRGATATNNETALSLVNRVRARAGIATWDAVTLNQLLDERGRELSMECWRRNDLIRFGKYESPWFVKVDNNTQKRIYSVPLTEIEANPLLTQNPGY